MKPRTGSNRRKFLDQAFSLIELLVVIAIVLILAGLLLAAVQQVILNSQKAKARVDVKTMAAAFDLYFSAYGKTPSCGDGHTVNDPDAIFNVIIGGDGKAGSQAAGKGVSDGWNDCGANDGTGGQRPSANPKHIVFMSIGPKEICDGYGYGQDPVWIDPWGYPYNFAYDINNDGVIDTGDMIWIQGGGWAPQCGGGMSQTSAWPGVANIHRYMVVWSVGPDHINGWGNPALAGGADDIISW